jgi:hypothetical protein
MKRFGYCLILGLSFGVSAYGQVPPSMQYGQPVQEFPNSQNKGKNGEAVRVQRRPLDASNGTRVSTCLIQFESIQLDMNSPHEFDAAVACVHSRSENLSESDKKRIEQLIESLVSVAKLEQKKSNPTQAKRKYKAQLQEIFKQIGDIEKNQGEEYKRVKRAPHEEFPTFSEIDQMSNEQLEETMSNLLTQRSQMIVQNSKIVDPKNAVQLYMHSKRDPADRSICRSNANDSCVNYLNEMADMNSKILLVDSYLTEYRRLERHQTRPRLTEESFASTEEP